MLIYHVWFYYLNRVLLSSLSYIQGPVWALCVSGDMLFSASSDNTIKVPSTYAYSSHVHNYVHVNGHSYAYI